VCYEAVRAVLGARGAPEEPLDVTEDHEEEATVVHRLRHRPKLQLSSGKGLRVCRIVLS
jgi:hypothetical protein